MAGAELSKLRPLSFFLSPSLSRTLKQIAWALNKGIKADYKQYWDVELGVTYVPWDKVKPEELESFCEGGMLDSDTLNPGNAALAGVMSLKTCVCPEKSWEISVYGKEGRVCGQDYWRCQTEWDCRGKWQLLWA